MARPGLLQHRKFKRLSRSVGSVPMALGSLELLWSSCYESGNDFVGTAEDIEAICEWGGTNGDLSAAFLSSGFIDRAEDGFRVHDLYDHAPEYVQRRMHREAARVAKGQTISDIRRQAANKRHHQLANDMQTDATGDHLHANDVQTVPNGATPSTQHPAPREETTSPLPPASGGTPPAAAVGGKPVRRKRGEALGLAILEMRPEESSAWERIEEAYPATGWNFATRSAQPRKRNPAEAARRFLRICRDAPIATGNGQRMTPGFLADATLHWLALRRAEARGGPPCVPNFENFFQLAEGETRHWQNAVLEFAAMEVPA